MQKIIVNGANGYVASHFVKDLLNEGYEVVAFVRETPGLSAPERLNKTLKEISARVNDKNLDVYNYSLNDHNYSLSQNQLDKIFDGEVDFFHFAACLKFKSRDRKEIFKTNVDGVRNSVKVFLENATKNSRFFFISTAYSCGKNAQPFKEDFYENKSIGAFRNYYEQSKRYAENTVREFMVEGDLKAHIVRLSQVVGNNSTGVTKTNYGIFDFINKIKHFSDKYPNKKIRVKIDPESTQNLIPIDNVTSYLLKLIKSKDAPTILNFVGRKPIKNSQILSSLREVLPIEIVPEKGIKKEELGKYERMIAAGMSFTGVYANTNLVFGTKNMVQAVSPNGNEITASSLHRMIDYFVKENLNGHSNKKLPSLNLKKKKIKVTENRIQ